MSSPDLSRRGLLGIAAVVLALPLAGCLRPLYGPTASGERMQDLLAAIEVAEVQTPPPNARLAHYLRSELVFDLNGTGQPQPKRFRLTVNASENVQVAVVDTITGRSDAATLVGRATYTLYDTTGRVVTTGTATQAASYDRSLQRFANIRAARDAEIRLAKVLSEQIKTRVAAALLTAS